MRSAERGYLSHGQEGKGRDCSQGGGKQLWVTSWDWWQTATCDLYLGIFVNQLSVCQNAPIFLTFTLDVPVFSARLASSFKTSLILFFIIQHSYCQKWMTGWRFSTSSNLSSSLNAELETLCTQKIWISRNYLKWLMCLKVNEIRCVLEEYTLKH